LFIVSVALPADGFYQSLLHGFVAAQDVIGIASSPEGMLQSPSHQARTPSHPNRSGFCA
jgi:hypothetical protein